MPSMKGLTRSVNEPSLVEYALKSVNPEEVLDQELIAELRRMAEQGTPAPGLVRRIQERHSLAPDSFLLPIVYLTHTFGIGINEASGICHGGNDLPARARRDEQSTGP